VPYSVQKRGNQFCVKKDTDGQTMGCHDTMREAIAQIAAIEANERRNRKKVNATTHRRLPTGHEERRHEIIMRDQRHRKDARVNQKAKLRYEH
jgi:hypothetical protein